MNSSSEEPQERTAKREYSLESSEVSSSWDNVKRSRESSSPVAGGDDDQQLCDEVKYSESSFTGKREISPSSDGDTSNDHLKYTTDDHDTSTDKNSDDDDSYLVTDEWIDLQYQMTLLDRQKNQPVDIYDDSFCLFGCSPPHATIFCHKSYKVKRFCCEYLGRCHKCLHQLELDAHEKHRCPRRLYKGCHNCSGSHYRTMCPDGYGVYIPK